MSFIMPYTDSGSTVHPESYWVLHAYNVNRITQTAVLIYHGWHQWEDYPDETKIIGEKVYTIASPVQYVDVIGLGDISSVTPFWASQDFGVKDLDNFFTVIGSTQYADTLPLTLTIDGETALPDLRGPDTVLVQLPDVVDLDSSSLARGLVASWKLDEATGATRVDAIGRTANDLTDHNNVARDASGKVGACAQFTAASSQYLSCASTADLKMDTEGTHILACWVKFTTVAAAMPIISKDAGGDVPAFKLWLNSDSKLEFVVGDFNIPYSAAIVDYAIGVPSAGQWLFVVCGYSTNDVHDVFISTNGGLIQYGAFLNPGGAVAADDGADFVIGANLAYGTYLNGLVDAVDKYHFTTPISRSYLASIIAALYNGGSGWESGSGNDWRTGVTISVNGSPVSIASATANMSSGSIWYKAATPFAASDVVTWEYDPLTGIIQNVPAGLPLGSIVAQPVDNQVGEGLDFSEKENSGQLLRLFI